MKQTVNSLVLNHLVMCANKAIAEREVTYTDGEYTAKHLATCQPAPAWDGKANLPIVVVINGKQTSCLWSDVFATICEFGGEDEVFKFATAKKNVTLITPKAAAPNVAAPEVEAPKPAPTSSKSAPKATKPKAKGKGKAKPAEPDVKEAIYGTCVEYSKSNPCMKIVRMSKQLVGLPTLYYYYDEKAGASRIYKLRDPESAVLHMVGGVKGDALADIERVKAIEKYKVIAEEGLQSAIDKGLISDMPHFKE